MDDPLVDDVPTRSPDDVAHRVAADGFGDISDDDSLDAEDPPPGTVTRGGRPLTDLADALRAGGLQVKEVDGWQSRSRGGKGYGSSGPAGIIVHHTASGPAVDGDRDVNYMTFEHENKPIANLYLDRSGRWWVLSAGASNTNGKGGPWKSIPENSANSRVIGIEAANNGVGEAWPEAMQDSYVRGVAALADRYRIAPDHILAHHEWAPSRKVDPAGPSRFGSINGSGSWDMNLFRAAVHAARGGAGPAPAKQAATAPPTGTTYVVKAGDSWWSIANATLGDPAKNWQKLADLNGGSGRVLQPGQVLQLAGGGSAPAPGGGPGAGAVPPFPGVAQRSDSGPAVLAWQLALIAKGVIRDNTDNRDSQYGDGMHNAVLKLQQSWGWSDADGIAGKHTWSKLHGGP